jgi:flagellar hook-length control protein FliK
MSMLSISSAPAPSSARDTTGALSGSRADSKPASGFDALLTAAPAPAGADNASAADTPAARQDSGTGTESEPEIQEEDAPGSANVEKPAPAAPDDSLDAPWPPLGLSGLIPVPLEPVPPPAASAAPAAAATPAATAMAAPATGPLPGQALQAIAPAAAPPASEAVIDTVPGQIALPANAPPMQVEERQETTTPVAFQQMLQSVATAEARTTAAPVVLATSVTPDVNSPEFEDAFGARIGWLADQKIGHAHIRVTPHEMGPIEVKLQLDGDRLHASFSSANADVRQALESSLPRLRDMLGEQGLQLAQADVGQQQSAPERDAAGPDASGSGDVRDGASDDALPAMSGHSLRLRGLLDAYA